MRQRALLFMLVIGFAGCGGSSGSSPSSPTTPTTTPTTPTRIISMSGDLAFGSVEVGKSAIKSFTIGNSGNATLTVSGIAGPSGGYSSDWTNGTIAAGASQVVRVKFEPTAPGTYNGTATVNADHTSGNNTISVSGTATAVTATTTALSVTGVSGDLKPNQTMQLTATATLSTGATQNVTIQATWTTSSAAVATVNGTGLVTAVAVGDVDIRAAYQGLSATVRVRVVTPAPATYCLDGVVTEKNKGAVLQGATAQVTGGPSGTTGSDGRYTLCGLSGTITVRVSATGYANQEFTLTLTANTSRSVTLTPSVSNSSADICNVSGPVRAECGTASAFCKDGWYSCSGNRSGTCSSHGGVQCWLCPGTLCSPFLGLSEVNWTPAGAAVCSAGTPY